LKVYRQPFKFAWNKRNKPPAHAQPRFENNTFRNNRFFHIMIGSPYGLFEKRKFSGVCSKRNNRNRKYRIPVGYSITISSHVCIYGRRQNDSECRVGKMSITWYILIPLIFVPEGSRRSIRMDKFLGRNQLYNRLHHSRRGQGYPGNGRTHYLCQPFNQMLRKSLPGEGLLAFKIGCNLVKVKNITAARVLNQNSERISRGLSQKAY